MRISDWSSDVCSSDLQHGAAPHPAGVQIGIIGLRSYGRWKEQHFRAHQRHDARSFRIPLVPAYADANRSVAGFPHLEAAIAGAEIIFFFVAWPVGDMTFAIDAHDFTRRSEEHTSELQSLMRISFAVFCLKKKTQKK